MESQHKSVLFLKNHLSKLNEWNSETLRNYIRTHHSHIVKIEFEKIRLNYNYDRILQVAIQDLQDEYNELSMDDLLQHYLNRTLKNKENREKSMSINYLSTVDSLELIFKWFSHQKIEPFKFIGELYSILNKSELKKNTFFIKGPSNSGKTLLITNPLREIIVNYGRINQLNVSSQFIFQNAINRRLIYTDEASCDPIHLETMKLLMAGEDAQVEVKGKAPLEIKRAPFIITSNEDVWHMKEMEKETFVNRMYYYQVKSYSELGKTEYLSYKIDPLSWVILFQVVVKSDEVMQTEILKQKVDEYLEGIFKPEQENMNIDDTDFTLKASFQLSTSNADKKKIKVIKEKKKKIKEESSSSSEEFNSDEELVIPP